MCVRMDSCHLFGWGEMSSPAALRFSSCRCGRCAATVWSAGREPVTIRKWSEIYPWQTDHEYKI